ncbi:hypothetical protein BGX21_010076 [Mortierella sp. AD011]|nr:hypothetical protein BGX20_006400 [Mortierella sp. AD010]KAF9395114.1 hypothetical protein BGX21_010076 [Mortierella sp. AD011]
MSDESYVLLGTPLPQTTKTDAFGEPKKPNPTRDLEASIFTLPTFERWTPSEFVSSRGKRSEVKVARPEDFMDEEDKQLISDAARLKTTADFDTVGSSRQELEMKRAAARNMQASGGVLGALPDTLIDDFVVPSSEPVGIRLLKRMGWKPGQGIGPRVSKRQRKPEDGPLSDDDADIPANVTFAPIDSAIVTFTNKTNRQGLGYDPYKDAPEFDRSLQGRKESKYLTTQSGGQKSRFGFGAFDDDDDDVYGSGPAILHSLDTDLDMDEGLYSRRKSKPENPESSKSDILAPMHCSDGLPPLRGFVLASKPLKPMKWYAGPKVPSDFDPHHIFHDDIKTVHPRREQPKLTADDRALVLGETPIDAPRRSVFEYISAENKSRLDNILGFVMDVDGDKRLKKDHWEVPKIEKSAAEAALMGFMPFSDNVAKQNRYKQYLNVQAGISDEKIELVEGFSGEDMTKELNEFVQAARIFKPLSSSMANRFTTATKVIEFAQPAAGLRSVEDIKTSEKTTPKPNMVEKMEIPKSQAAKAAAMGMFGPLTRTVVEFYPSKLLCKRFNVPNPHPEHKDLGPETAKDLLDKKTMDAMMMNRAPGGGMSTDDIIQETPQGSSATDTQDLAEDAAKLELEDEVLQERPSMDIFKAIFDDSDSDSDIGSDSESNGKKLTPVQDASSSDVDPGAAIAKTESEKIEMDSELRPSEPFRPMFTKKSERPGAHPLISTRVQSRSSKLDFSHLNDDNEYEEDEMGPKISLKKPKLKSNVTKDSSSATKRSFDEADGNISRSEAVLSARSRPESPDNFIGPPMPDKIDSEEPVSSLQNEDSYSSKRVKSSSSTTHRTSSHKESSSSSSRHKSSSSRLERDERSHSSSSRSRHRSTSKTRRRSRDENVDDGAGYGSEGDSGEDRGDTSKDGENRKKRSELTSTSSRSKSGRHREHRSRSRSKSLTRSNKEDRDKERDRVRDRGRDRDRGKDRGRDRDRDKDRDKVRDRDRDREKDKDKEKDRHRRRDHDRDSERSSKRSRSDKHWSKHRHRDRDHDEESNMEGLWVEKNIEVSSSAPPAILEPPTPPVQPVNRIRASDFF